MPSNQDIPEMLTMRSGGPAYPPSLISGMLRTASLPAVRGPSLCVPKA